MSRKIQKATDLTEAKRIATDMEEKAIQKLEESMGEL
jgi:hypothetical protein